MVFYLMRAPLNVFSAARAQLNRALDNRLPQIYKEAFEGAAQENDQAPQPTPF